MLAEEVKTEDTIPWASIYFRISSRTGRYSPRGFHICQQKKSNRKFISQWLPYMLAEVVEPEDTLPGSSIYVSRSSQTGIYSPMGFHISQQKKSNRNILSHGIPYILAEEVKPDDTRPGASIYVSRRSQTGSLSLRGFHICQQKKSYRKILSQWLPYVIRRNRTGRYSPRGFHICQQKQSNRKILSTGLPYMLAEEVNRTFISQGLPYMLAEVVKPEDTLPGSSIYVSRSSQTGIYSPMGFHICQQKKSNRKMLSQVLPYMLAEEVKPEDTLPGASIYVSRRSQTGIYSPMGFHIFQQKKSNRKILSQGLPYMLAEEVKPEDTLPGLSIQKKSNRQSLSQGLPYVSRSSQTGRYSPRGFHICQQKQSDRKILSQGLPYMLAEVVKPEYTLPWASIYVSRRSQTGRCSPKCFHICQQKKSNRKILSQGLPYMLAEEVKPEDTLPVASVCQQKKSNRKILSQGLPYMLAEVVEPEDTLHGASIYVSRRSQTGSLSPRGFHICQQKQSNRKILSQGLPYMLAEVVKPEYTLPWASIYVSRRSQTGRCSPKCFHICQQKKSNRKILSQGLPYMLAEEVKPEYTHPWASIYFSRRSQTGR